MQVYESHSKLDRCLGRSSHLSLTFFKEKESPRKMALHSDVVSLQTFQDTSFSFSTFQFYEVHTGRIYYINWVLDSFSPHLTLDTILKDSRGN